MVKRVGGYWLSHFLIVPQESQNGCGGTSLFWIGALILIPGMKERTCIRSHSHPTAGTGMEPGLLVVCPELIPIPEADWACP